MADSAALQRWEAAAERISWHRRWDILYEPGERGGRWFPGAMLNAAENCVDRHVGRLGDKVAFHWEGEPGDRRALTYRELHAEVCAFADALRGLGVGLGDRVAIYMGLLPETIVAMLACARLGAVHALMASALPADALADRLADLEPKVLVTQDGSWRHGVMLPLKARADEAIPAASGVEQTIVVRRTGIDVAWYEGDRWYDEFVAGPGTAAASEPPRSVPADHPLLVVYIANRRGRPTGIVHGTAGFLVYAAELHASGLGPEEEQETFWCAVEPAWVGGQSHLLYGPLACGATSVIYEGMLDTPSHGRTWELIERYRVAALMTTPSVFRNVQRWTDSPPRREQLASLTQIVTAGEAIEPELRDWLVRDVGGGAVVVADGWGQTELGGGVRLQGGRREPPDAGLDVVDVDGQSVDAGVKGELVLRAPWPATFIGFQNDDPEAAADYWGRYADAYATGDWAVREPDGSFVFLGRIDPVVTVSGQLVSLAEIREALLEHPFVGDVEIVDRVDLRSGRLELAACVVLVGEVPADDELARSLRAHVRERVGGLAQPQIIAFVEAFPADLTRDLVGPALRALCAAEPAETFGISADELRAAASETAAR